MLRRLRLIVLPLTVAGILSACDGLSVETSKRVAAVDAGEDTSQDDTADASSDGGADTNPPDVTNGCGGTGALSYRGASAEPGAACGRCGDGTLVCVGLDELACIGASSPNACGGCGILAAEPGTACGLCGDGVWQCGGGALACIGDSDPNGCGGCGALSAAPGDSCRLAPGDEGLTVCVGRTGTACVSLGRNLCGGADALRLPPGVAPTTPARPGVRYESGCISGVLYCEGSELAALDIEGANACGGCSPLLGLPQTACNACGAVWTCTAEGDVACTGERPNACGGCSELPTELGQSCGDQGGRTACDGADSVGCLVSGVTNRCGGLTALVGPTLGTDCGECLDGTVVCDGSDPQRARTVCDGAAPRNACAGCGLLDATPGAPCGTCGSGTVVCAADGTACDGDAGASALNACGGCSSLAASLGDPCGICGTTVCDAEIPGAIRCDEPDGGCVEPAICGNGAIEEGEACDDTNSVTEDCPYGEVSCSVCASDCQLVAGRVRRCGDAVADPEEACDDGDSIDTNACSNACQCAAGFHSEGGFCRSDLRPCILANATGASQQWDGAAYGECRATACSANFDLADGRCLASSPQPLGFRCIDDLECLSGNCASEPSGLSSDRCAPEGMLFVAPGSFTMGSPETELGRDPDELLHRVTLTRSFFLDTTETTQSAWTAQSGGVNPAYFQDLVCLDGGCAANENANPTGPVERVDWFSALAFANAKSVSEGLEACYTLFACSDPASGWVDGQHAGCTSADTVGPACTGYRLPTEAEWEFAARGGTGTATYAGDLLADAGCVNVAGAGGFDAGTPLATIACYICNSGNRSALTGQKLPNGMGLSDMLGNVWEWTESGYEAYAGDATDPLGLPSSESISVRGGSWYSGARYQRAALRNAYPRETRFGNLGFRLARTAP